MRKDKSYCTGSARCVFTEKISPFHNAFFMRLCTYKSDQRINFIKLKNSRIEKGRERERNLEGIGKLVEHQVEIDESKLGGQMFFLKIRPTSASLVRLSNANIISREFFPSAFSAVRGKTLPRIRATCA